MEARKSQDLQLSSWRLWKAKGVVPVHIWRPENQESQWHKFQSKIQQAEDPRTDVPVQVWRQEKPNVPVQGNQAEGIPLYSQEGQSAFFFYLSFQLIGWGPSHGGEQSVLLILLIQVLISFQNIFTNPE